MNVIYVYWIWCWNDDDDFVMVDELWIMILSVGFLNCVLVKLSVERFFKFEFFCVGKGIY